MSNLKSIMEANGSPSLKALAVAVGVPAPRMYAVAKQPQEGMIYDAKVFNWDAIERFCERRLDAEKGIGSFEDLVAKAVEAEAELREADGRKKGGRTITGTVEVDGKTIPVRKFPNFEMDANMLVAFKKEAGAYKIVYQTVSHTVLVPVLNMAGDIASQEVKVVSNAMMNIKGIGPVQLEAELAKRFA